LRLPRHGRGAAAERSHHRQRSRPALRPAALARRGAARAAPERAAGAAARRAVRLRLHHRQGSRARGLPAGDQLLGAGASASQRVTMRGSRTMRFLRAAVWVAAFAALLAGCSGAGDKVVNVYNWSDYIDPQVLKDFEKQYGIKVNYDVYDKNEVLETKLLTGNTGFDVVVPSAPFLELEIRAGALAKLDKATLSNLRYLDPAVARSVGQYDPGNQYAADYMWITSGLGYNLQAVHARMPDAPVDSWRLLYDPALVAKFKDCGVTVLDEPTEVIGTALLYLGKDPNSESPADLAAAMKVLMAIRPYVRYVNSSRYIDDLANGEICLALGWSGDVKQAEV